MTSDPVMQFRKQIIKAKWLAGATSGQIAKALKITRNAVMGHINRMKLVGRSESSSQQQGVAAAKKSKPKPKGFALGMIPGLGLSVSKDKKPPQRAVKDGLEPLGPIGDFPPDRTTCRAISGDVATGNWRCCARPGYPYCTAHSEKFLTAPKPRPRV